MKILVQLLDRDDQTIESDSNLTIELDESVLVIAEHKPGEPLRAVAFFAPGIWLAAREITDED